MSTTAPKNLKSMVRGPTINTKKAKDKPEGKEESKTDKTIVDSPHKSEVDSNERSSQSEKSEKADRIKAKIEVSVEKERGDKSERTEREKGDKDDPKKKIKLRSHVTKATEATDSLEPLKTIPKDKKPLTRQRTSEKTPSAHVSTTLPSSIGKKTTTVKAQRPMPKDPEEVSRLFEQVLAALNSSEETKSDLRRMGLSAKWVFVQSNLHRLEDTSEKAVKVSSLAQELANSSKVTLETVKRVRSELNTLTNAFIDEFRSAGGVSNFVEILVHQSQSKHSVSNDIQIECLKALSHLIQANRGTLDTLLNQNLINKIALSLFSSSSAVKNSVFEIFLLLIQLRGEFHPYVVKGMDYFSYKIKEKMKYEYLVKILKYEEDMELKAIVVSFINSLIGEPEEPEERVLLRSPFLSLDLLGLFSQFKSSDLSSTHLLDGIKDFEEDLKQDEEELKDKLKEIDTQLGKLDLCDSNSLFQGLVQRLSKFPYLEQPFKEIIQAMLFMPVDRDLGLRHWLILAGVHEQLVAHKDELQFGSKATIIDLEQLLIAVEGQAKYFTEREKHLLKQAEQREKIEQLEKQVEEVQDLREKVKEVERKLALQEGLVTDKDMDAEAKLQVELKKVKRENKRYKSNQQKLTTNILELETKLNTVERDLTIVRSELEDTNNDIANKTKKFSKESAESLQKIQDLTQLLEGKEQEINTLKTKVVESGEAKIESIRKGLEEKNTESARRLEREFEDKRRALERKHAEDLRVKLTKATEEFEKEKVALISSSARSAGGSMVESTVAKYTQVIEKLTRDGATLKAELNELAGDKDRMEEDFKKKLKEQELKILSLGDEKQTLVERVAQLRDERKDIDRVVLDLKQRLSDADEEAKRRTARYKMKKEIASTQAKDLQRRLLTQLEDLKNEFSLEKSRLLKQIDAEQEAIEDERKQFLEQRQNSEASFRASMENMAQQLKNAVEELGILKAERIKIDEGWRKQILIVQVDKERTEKKLDELKTELDNKDDQKEKEIRQYREKNAEIGKEVQWVGHNPFGGVPSPVFP
eukprot:TRINITY_DN4377_c0_g2_i6.p1 TRINITY_DN4377_c0_g2~~TRINITY_DN4377_c0_g2_i6.p1  ORF type:complete len:1041 (-),score=304.17 TRINITY_DN4377_c0_g2_i6:1691-4813(-)